MLKLLFFGLILLPVVLIAQKFDGKYLTTEFNINELSKKDSILIEEAIIKYNNASTDTGKIKALSRIVEESYNEKAYDAYNEVIFKLIDHSLPNAKGAIKDSLLNWKGYAYYIRGLAATDLSKYEKAIESYNNVFKYLKEDKYQYVIGDTYGNLSIVYKGLGDYNMALESIRKAIEIRSKINDEMGMANSYSSLGNIYISQGAYQDALENYKKALAINKRINNFPSLASNYNNIAYVNVSFLDDFEESKAYYLKSYQLFDSLRSKTRAASALANIGSVHLDLKQHDTAIFYFNKALKMKEEVDDYYGTANIYLNMATIWFEKGDLDKAIVYAEKSKAINKESNDISNLMSVEQNLAQYYKHKGQYQKAYFSLYNYYDLRDSIKNEENLRATMREEERRNFLIKSIADSVQYEKDLEISKLENQKSKAELENKEKENAILYGGIFVVVLLGGFVGLAYRRKRKDNKIISEQKQIVEQQRDEVSKQKEIVEIAHNEIKDSINYAKRLQDAILPSMKFVKESFKDSFVLYRPKDIVSGDFYWMETKGNQIFLAAADCTGHGVPGAMVSVVCANALNKAVNEYGKTDPAEILNVTRDLVIATFAKAGSEVKDGMDISLIAINKPSEGSQPSEGLFISYAGANNPLWIIRKGAAEVKEIKADKQPIGLYGDLKTFNSHEVQINEGDTIYMFSDGFVDQFGGEKGKKFKSKKFKDLLLSIQDKSMDEQKMLIDDAFNQWKGDLEQVDDVCIIGVRI